MNGVGNIGAVSRPLGCLRSRDYLGSLGDAIKSSGMVQGSLPRLRTARRAISPSFMLTAESVNRSIWQVTQDNRK